MSNSLTIANTILSQLGGNRFTRMTGAREYVAQEAGLRMRLPSNLTRNRNTHCTIILQPDDTYAIEVAKWSRKELRMKNVQRLAGIYCDQLRDSFRLLTGLETSL